MALPIPSRRRRTLVLEPLESRLLLSKSGLPDLAVENLVVPAAAQAASTITISYDVENIGKTAMTQGWSDSIYVGASSSVKASAVPAATEAHAAPLAAGASQQVSLDLALPPGPARKLYVVVYTDEGGQSGSKATARLLTTAPPAVDLVPLDLTSSPLVAGQSATLDWDVQNNGPVPAQGDWLDSVYFSHDSSLGSGDILLATLRQSAEVAFPGTYHGESTIVVPSACLGPGYLILVVNSDHAANEPGAAARNDVLKVPVEVVGINLPTIYGGEFLPRGAANVIRFSSDGGAAGATLDISLGSYGPLPLGASSGETPPSGDVALVSDYALPAGLLKNGAVSCDTSALPYGYYLLTVTLTEPGQAPIVEQAGITLVEDCIATTDSAVNAIGGAGYQIYNMDVGRVGDLLLFRVGTDYGGADGDFRLRVQPKGGAQSTFAIPVAGGADVQSQPLTQGDLCTSAVFLPGTANKKNPALLDSYAQDVPGVSFAGSQPHTGLGDWEYDITGGVLLSAIGRNTGNALSVAWTMPGGNDEAQVSYKDPQPVPTVLQLNSLYGGSSVAGDIGRYVAGCPLQERFSVTVQSSHGDPVVAVVFDVGGNQILDANGADGWSCSVDTGTLTGPTPITVTAVDAAGRSSAAYAATLSVLPAPSWLPPAGATSSLFDNVSVKFLKSTRTYDFTMNGTLLENSPSLPSDLQGLGDLQLGGKVGYQISLLVPLNSSPVQATVVGATSLKILGSYLPALPRTIPAGTQTLPQGTVSFQSSVQFDNQLELTALAGTLDVNLNLNNKKYSLSNLDLYQDEVTTTPTLSLTTGAIQAHAAFQYVPADNMVEIQGTANFTISGSGTLSGDVTVSAPGILGSILTTTAASYTGPVSYNITASVTPPDAPVLSAPCQVSLTATLDGPASALSVLSDNLGWSGSTYTFINFNGDLDSTQ